jgi:hypothetical protein
MTSSRPTAHAPPCSHAFGSHARDCRAIGFAHAPLGPRRNPVAGLNLLRSHRRRSSFARCAADRRWRAVSLPGASLRLQFGRAMLAKLLLLFAGGKTRLGPGQRRHAAGVCDRGGQPPERCEGQATELLRSRDDRELLCCGRLRRVRCAARLLPGARKRQVPRRGHAVAGVWRGLALDAAGEIRHRAHRRRLRSFHQRRGRCASRAACHSSAAIRVTRFVVWLLFALAPAHFALERCAVSSR